MIFCHDKIFAKVWKVTPYEKYLELQASTSEKDRNGNYINSSWYIRCIGHAFNSLSGKVKEGDKITITKSKLSNEKYTAKDGTTKSAFRFLALEAEIDTPDNRANQSNPVSAFGDGEPSFIPEPAQQRAEPIQEEIPW